MYNYHSWLEVNLDHLTHNFKTLQKYSKPVYLAAVLKANAYGLGAVRIGRHLEALNLDVICVANISEALELRYARIFTPILVMGYVPENAYPLAIQNDIELTLYDVKTAEKLSAAGRELGKRVRCHVKVDTGMSRLGFAPTYESACHIAAILELPALEVKGIYTHFSSADEEDRSYTRHQYEKFMDLNLHLAKLGIKIPVKHISNDAGALYHGYFLDMVRSGISLYGYYPSDFIASISPVRVKPLASFFTTISHIKSIERGSFIGYNRTFCADRPMTVATLAIGYADGYPIEMSNRGYVLIRGKKAPIVGKVCMDQTMVDVSEISGIKAGEPVLLYGEDAYGSLPLETVAGISGKLHYDLLCATSMRIPRIYRREGRTVHVTDYLKF